MVAHLLTSSCKKGEGRSIFIGHAGGKKEADWERGLVLGFFSVSEVFRAPLD